MKKFLNLATGLLFVGFAVALALDFWYPSAVIRAVAITMGTAFYHFAMRLTVGVCVSKRTADKQFNEDNLWFREKKWERRLLQWMKIKKWKNYVPTYNPASFDIEKCTVEGIIQESCRAELVHEIIIVMSFMPLILIRWFGEPIVFIGTSVCAGIVDGVFVILQRYNRPRLSAVAKRQGRDLSLAHK